MSTTLFSRGLVLMLMVSLFAVPASYLLMPQTVHAQGVGVQAVVKVGSTAPSDLGTWAESAFTAVKSAISAVATVSSAASNAALVIDKYVLEPIAFVMSGNLLKAITASVLKFVNGQTNGTGTSQFVQNLRGHLQGVGDTQALSFFAQFGGNSNSPFASAITSSLRTNYLQQTSVAGFFAGNQCTLSQFSPNINQFLAGNWSQGGTGAWFALTTQNQNNPYLLHQRAQAELFNLVQNATDARLSELSWGNGFLSWCGPSTAESGDTSNFNNGGAIPTVTVTPQQTPTCTQKDGSPGNIQTPGTLIASKLHDALSYVDQKLVQMGLVGPEINTILGNIANVMNTVNFASDILGGNSGGLASVGNSSSNGSSRLSQFENSSGFLGVTQASVNKDAANLPASGGDMQTRVTQYQTAWTTISTAATTASTSLTSLAASCAAQSSAAKSALTLEVAPVFVKYAAAQSAIQAAAQMIAQVQADLNSTSAGSGGAYSADLATLQAMPPTIDDLVQAQHDAQSSGGAQATPTGSLTVSATALVDQMNLIAANANALANSCGTGTTATTH